MTVQQLEYLADGLSVSACGRTLVLDRTRVNVRRDGHDVLVCMLRYRREDDASAP